MIEHAVRSERMVGTVLAGGGSRRFGRDKALLKYNGRTLLDLAVGKLLQLCDEVVISVDRPRRYRTDVRQVPDLQPGGGAAVGILSVLQAFPDASMLVTPVDMPLLPVSLLRRLLGQRQQASAVVLGAADRLQPLVGVYGPRVAPVLRTCIDRGEKKMLEILTHLKPQVVSATQPELSQLINVNTPSDFSRLVSGIEAEWG